MPDNDMFSYIPVPRRLPRPRRPLRRRQPPRQRESAQDCRDELHGFFFFLVFPPYTARCCASICNEISNFMTRDKRPKRSKHAIGNRSRLLKASNDPAELGNC